MTLNYKKLNILYLLLAPCFDLAFIGFAVILDGGQASSLFLFFLIVVFIHGIHFGNAILFYTQALSLLVYLMLCTWIYIDARFTIDSTLLALQLLSLVILPTYIYHLNKLKQAQQERHKTNHFDALDLCPLAAFTFLQDTHLSPRISFANHAMQEIYRDNVISLIGEQVDIIALMADGDEVIYACQAVFTSKDHTAQHFYVRGRDKQDHILKLHGQCHRIDLHDTSIGMCFLTNITDSVNFQHDTHIQLQQAYNHSLIASIAHDFRNILTGMIGSAEVMQFSVQDQALIDQLELIISTGERGAKFTEDLLKKSILEFPQSTDQQQATYNCIKHSIACLRLNLPHQIQLKLEIDSQLPNLHIPDYQFAQIIISLVNNASQAMQHSGSITVQIKTNFTHQFSQNSTPALQLNVIDEGCGMPSQTIELATKGLWEDKHQAGHLGIGLSLVKRITQQYGGLLDITSTVGKGSQVAITLPPSLHKKNPIYAQPIEKKTPLAVSEKACDEYIINDCLPLQKWSILLVDDNPEVLHVHQHLLECMGLQVSTAQHGEHALKLWKQQQKGNPKYDLLITDYRMPGMDGVELCHRIRQININLPILMITAYGEAEKLQEATSIQVSILNKPVSYKKLQQEISLIQARYKASN